MAVVATYGHLRGPPRHGRQPVRLCRQEVAALSLAQGMELMVSCPPMLRGEHHPHVTSTTKTPPPQEASHRHLLFVKTATAPKGDEGVHPICAPCSLGDRCGIHETRLAHREERLKCGQDIPATCLAVRQSPLLSILQERRRAILRLRSTHVAVDDEGCAIR